MDGSGKDGKRRILTNKPAAGGARLAEGYANLTPQ